MNNTAENKLYTYADYLTFPEDECVEIIDGHIYKMAAAPSRKHQELISQLLIEIGSYIKSNNGSCKVYPAPFDVILRNGDEDINNSKNVVQPDISIICDKNKLTDKGCTGAPDMIVEVVSPFNPSNDYVRKLNLYEEFKVREYWIVNPMEETVFVYRLDTSTMHYASPKSYTFKDIIKVGIYENLQINFATLNL
ncbi:Uma2 family endonuclease [Clostridium hydrogenum]|uniref:Uma2 family endonuclease n=1 Tax=Clostridium hydrogenum TaxID=2855764 RepID=UPI001F20D520|nr:Uma2 family endonuclease [Clostridium hydrogenum]